MTITNNKALSSAGGIYLSSTRSTTFTECVINHNECDISENSVNGGGIYITGFSSNTQYHFINCTIAYNQSGGNGGGMVLTPRSAIITMTNCTVYRNVTGIAPKNFNSTTDGGGILFSAQSASATFTHCTITENSFAPGPGTKRGAGIANGRGFLRLHNSIVANNTGATMGNDLRIAISGPAVISSLIRSCAGCTNPPTYFSDPMLDPPTTCGEHIFLAPQAGSDALDNGSTVGVAVPFDDICGKIRVGPHDIGSYDKSGIVPPPPVAECKDITVALDAIGNATILAGDVDDGSTALSGVSSLVVAPNMFTCSDIGTKRVTLTITDNLGLMDDCMANVTVTAPNDATPPTITCPSAVVKKKCRPCKL